jgi:hypothetical protein
MRLTRVAICAAFVFAGSAVATASDPIAVYARVDRVVMEPNDDAPERIQVWGVFSIAERSNPNTYHLPDRGYLYFRIPDANGTTALREWNDLKQVAGSGQIVAFGSRYEMRVRPRQPDERPDAPDTYSLNIGVRKMRAETDYAPIRAIATFKP